MDKKSTIVIFLKIITFILDIILIQVSVLIVYYLRLYLYYKNMGFYPLSGLKPYFSTYPIVTMIVLILFYIHGLYNPEKKTWREIFISIISVFLIMIFIKTFISFFLRVFGFPRSVLLLSFFSELPIFYIYRYLIWKILKKYSEVQEVIMFKKRGEILYEILSKNIYNIKEIVELDENCDFNKIEEYAKNGYNILISSSFSPNFKKIASNIALQYGKKVFFLPNFYEFIILSSKINPIEGDIVINFDGFELPIYAKFLKRFIDILISFFALLILSPIFLIISILIKIFDKGPVFYLQERVGLNGKTFKIIKFRTMIIDAEKYTGPMLASDNDIRITKIGKILRKYRLDEIPQFFNVLKGDMSIVGPRPERGYYVREFEKKIPLYKYRLKVKPGITGLAQIFGSYSTSFEEKLLYDLLYIVKWTFMLDIWIIILTLRTILTPEKAR